MSAGRGARFGEVFAEREFRALWFSQAVSVTGDRLALVALALLVYQRTGSALLTAAAYAAGFVPWVAGGLVLARLADRLPRRGVMAGCDVIRAGLVAVMTLPGEPVAALVILLFAATSLAPLFEAARAAITPEILAGDRYVVATAVVQTTYRAAMVAGYAAGGVVVGVIGARPALAADALSFLVSAAAVRFGLRRRAAVAERHPGRSALADIASGIRLVVADRRLRTLMLMGWLVVFYAVPEGIAAPYVHALGGGSGWVGLVLAAGAFGGVLAAPVFTRLAGPARRLALMGPLAVGACGVLLACLARPGLAASLAVFSVSGACGVYQIAANAAFVTAVPPHARAQAFGLANAGLIAGQGVTFVLAGAAVGPFGPQLVIVGAGAAGAVAGAALAIAWHRNPPPP